MRLLRVHKYAADSTYPRLSAAHPKEFTIIYSKLAAEACSLEIHRPEKTECQLTGGTPHVPWTAHDLLLEPASPEFADGLAA
jgi:hypothetical protein